MLRKLGPKYLYSVYYRFFGSIVVVKHSAGNSVVDVHGWSAEALRSDQLNEQKFVRFYPWNKNLKEVPFLLHCPLLKNLQMNQTPKNCQNGSQWWILFGKRKAHESINNGTKRTYN
jgi:hypothetical protein